MKEVSIKAKFLKRIDAAILELEAIRDEIISMRDPSAKRKCPVCEQEYWPKRIDQTVCSKACRQKKYCANPEYNRHRRDVYAQKTGKIS